MTLGAQFFHRFLPPGASESPQGRPRVPQTQTSWVAACPLGQPAQLAPATAPLPTGPSWHFVTSLALISPRPFVPKVIKGPTSIIVHSGTQKPIESFKPRDSHKGELVTQVMEELRIQSWMGSSPESHHSRQLLCPLS